MNFSNVSDLAQSLILRRRNVELKSELSRLTQELTSGVKKDIGSAVSGDYSYISSIEKSLALHDSYAVARADVSGRVNATELALGALQATTEDVGPSLLSSSANPQEPEFSARVADMADRFRTAVSTLNTEIGGQFLFSGVASTTKPLAAAEDMLADLRAVAQTVTTPADLLAAVDTWFNAPGGGFDTLGYQGGAASDQSIAIGPNQAITAGPTANSEATKDVLQGLALLTLVSEGYPPGGLEVRGQVVEQAASKMIAANDKLITLRAEIGSKQQQIEASTMQVSIERLTLSEARNNIRGVDPFEAASELEAVQLQLESLYLITARTSRLNLTEYLR